MAGTDDTAAPPITAGNAPFLERIDYRNGDYSELRYRLLERLAQTFPNWNRHVIEKRGARDLGVTFVELYAYLGDVLGFYQDARANESFLRTAILPASIIELTALIDYRPAPGASAETLQAFLLKAGANGAVPVGFRLKATSPTDGRALIYETQRALAADAARNRLKLLGHDRSARVLRVSVSNADATDAYATLDQNYDGLKTGGLLVLSGPTTSSTAVTRYALPITAVNDPNGRTRVDWVTPSAGELRFPIADLSLYGKPKQIMPLAARERADEISVGQQSARVLGNAIAPNDLVLFAFNGVFEAARVINKVGNTITWNRGFMIPLRRSAVRLYTATPLGPTGSLTLRPGSTTVYIGFATYAAASALDLQGGDHLLLADAAGVERVTVAGIIGISTHFVSVVAVALAQPLARAIQANATAARVRLPDSGLTTHISPESVFKPMTLADAGINATGGNTPLPLDRTYEDLAPAMLVAVTDGTRRDVCEVESVALAADGRTVLTVMGTLDPAYEVATFAVHGPFEHTMHVDGFDRADGSLPVDSTKFDLDIDDAGLSAGDYLVIEGGGQTEGVRISGVNAVAGHTEVTFDAGLQHAYPLADTVVYGNVAPIAHRETVIEQIVGSGDHTQAGQQFTLKRSPVSFRHDPAAERGVSSTLEVYVNDERWSEVTSLAESGPADRHYAIAIDDEQRLTLQFGDGVHGAKLPTGRDNVRVRYGVGLGRDGNVVADAIVAAAEPLQFVESTRNPLAAAGGADREAVAESRRLAPMTVRALDRAVSLSDYADLALTFGGIAKARADWDWRNRRRVILVTVACAGGNALTPQLSSELLAFLGARRAPHHRVLVRDYRPYPVYLGVQVTALPQFLRAETQTRVLQALGAGLDENGEPGYFHFDRRALGTDLYLSDVYGLVERVRGVDHVLATAFHAENESAALRDRIVVPADALARGGDPTDAAIGRLVVQVSGGLA